MLALYDPNKETKVTADASSFGLGGVVLQLQPDNSRRPVSLTSRAMTSTEIRYAQIEMEALALTWALNDPGSTSWENQSLWKQTIKPLVPLLSAHTLDRHSPKTQRFRMRLMRFHLKENKHVPGKKMYIADALSRFQIRSQTVKSTTDVDEMHAHIGSVNSSLPVWDGQLQQIMEAQEEDPVCRHIKVYCCEGLPDKYSLNDAMKPYWSSRGELSVVQNILLKASRIVIPSSMRLEILDKIHKGHQGITKCRERAKNFVWWLRLSRGSGATMQSLRSSNGQQDWTTSHDTLTWPSLANRSHRPLRAESRWLTYCYRPLLKIRGSGGYVEDYEVKWGHQST